MEGAGNGFGIADVGNDQFDVRGKRRAGVAMYLLLEAIEDYDIVSGLQQPPAW
jgi:hypothetical protein